ncbi:MAG TPA: N-6 DNA methylase [Anaeromyxobacteraceae bacterium]|nr:N-6 DNA methylase [Anaeromyxobacteraceae bacterium]
MSGRGGDPGAALEALAALTPAAALRAATRRLRGERRGPLARFPGGSELAPRPGRLDGRLLEAVCARALAGAPGSVYTGAAEARLLAAFGLAHAAALRGGPEPAAALAGLLGRARPSAALKRALDGLRVLDPACGAGSLLAAAEVLARGAGARLWLAGIELQPLAARACSARLALLGARARVERGDALFRPWPPCDLVLMNPPFVRHESMEGRAKARAVSRSGLSAQADLSAHFVALALSRARVAGLVLPRALETARSAEPLRALARARGGFALRLRSRAAGSFAASVDTALAVWREGGGEAPAAEASVPLPALQDAELCALARGRGSRRLSLLPARAPAPRGAVRVGDVSQVRFGVKSGCNAFFHLRRLGPGRFESQLAGEVRLAPGDVVPLLAGLKEARAPELVEPGRWLFRPAAPTPTALAYLARGEALGVARRPTCAGRSPWWRLAPGRPPAPVLYPAKVGARAFAVLNRGGLYEDKKWHALFPLEVEPWLLALLLSATPLRLAVDRAARQLTGAQAIADVDCRVLASAPFPAPAALAPLRADLRAAWTALRRDPVSTDLAAMLDRPAQRELDRLAGRALGLAERSTEAARRELLARVEARLAHAEQVRRAVAGSP